MSNELEDYVEARPQQLSTPNDVNLENGNNSTNSCQSLRFITDASASSCDIFNATLNTGGSNTANGCFLNGSNVKSKNNEYVPSAGFNGDRAALYRNIYNSSSSEDEDEHCVYTYKGAEVGSDLPQSFLNLRVNGQNGENMSGRSSPEMDFLEMDFDPGPSNEQDSDSDSASLYRPSTYNHRDSDMRPASENADRGIGDRIDKIVYDAYDENANCCSNNTLTNFNKVLFEGSLNQNSVSSIEETKTMSENACCSKNLTVNETDSGCMRPFGVVNSKYSDSSSDEESSTSKNDIAQQCSKTQDENIEVDRHVDDQKSPEDSDSEDITFIPSGHDHFENYENFNENLFENLCDISLIHAGADANDFVSYDDLLALDPSYSISAVVNVMKIFNNFICTEREKLVNLLRAKQVTESTPLVEYLFMRSVQNANEVDLANIASVISENKLHSRFFSTYPSAHFNLVEWLYSWMRKGAVPVVTRNIQDRGTLAAKNIIRNPWRHNVVYKLESPFIHVSNPYEKVPDCILHSQLSQPSLIYVKSKCIRQKWHSKVDLRLLMRASHNRWYNENVLGQVATVIRECDNETNLTKYVRIPSNCRCGITLFVPSENSTLCREVDEAAELTSAVCY